MSRVDELRAIIAAREAQLKAPRPFPPLPIQCDLREDDDLAQNVLWLREKRQWGPEHEPRLASIISSGDDYWAKVAAVADFFKQPVHVMSDAEVTAYRIGSFRQT